MTTTYTLYRDDKAHDLTVEYDYQQDEPANYWGEYPEPGSDEAVMVEDVFLHGRSVFDCLTLEEILKMEERILEGMKDE